jgi:hypothetical protein
MAAKQTTGRKKFLSVLHVIYEMTSGIERVNEKKKKEIVVFYLSE